MKGPIRNYLINLLSLYLMTQYDKGFAISGEWSVYLYASLLMTIINTFIKPVLKILFLPINMLTLGVFSWVINLVALYLLTRIVPQITIQSWVFPGMKSWLLALPSMTLTPFFNFIFVSFSLSCISRLCHWLAK